MKNFPRERFSANFSRMNFFYTVLVGRYLGHFEKSLNFEPLAFCHFYVGRFHRSMAVWKGNTCNILISSLNFESQDTSKQERQP